jgi:hypothetical protein
MFQSHLVAGKMKTSLPVTNETTIKYLLTRKLNYYLEEETICA